MNPKLEAIRRRIEYEHSLINQRLSWLVSSQAFLLSAFAISLNAPIQFTDERYHFVNHKLIQYIPIGAICCIVVLWLTLWGAMWSLTILRREANAATLTEDLPVLNSNLIRGLGLAAPALIPPIFLILWIILIF